MAETDIELKVGLDTKDVSAKSKALRGEISRIFSHSALDQTDKKMQTILASMSKVSTAAEKVGEEIENLKDADVPTQEFQALSDKMDELETKIYNARMEQQRMAELGASQDYLNTMTKDISKMEAEMQQASNDMGVLVEKGKDFIPGAEANAEKISTLEGRLKDLNNQMVIGVTRAYDYNDSLRGLDGAEEQTEQQSSTLSRILSSVGSGFKNLASLGTNAAKSLASKLTPAMNNFGKSMKKSMDHKHVSKFGSVFKKFLMAAIGVRGLYMLFRKLVNGVKEGIKNMAQMNGGNNEVNKSISMLMSSLTQLKNAWAAAFAPILTAIAPALNQLIQLCISAANAVGMLIAKLTGQSYFVKAKKVTQDYAKSLKGAGSAAKGALAAFDDLNVLDKQSGGGGSDLSPEQMFEKVPVDEMMGKLADFFKPFKEAWDEYGQFVIDSWKYGLEEVLLLAAAIGDSFMEVWTNGSGEEMLGHILVIVGDIGLIVGNLAHQFREAWETNDIGTQIFQDMFDIINLILGSIEDCATASATWSANLDFYPLLQGVLTMLDGIKSVIEPLSSMLTVFYTSVLLPLGTWLLESLVPVLLRLSGDILKVIGDALTELQPVLEWLLTEFIVPIASEIGGVLVGALEKIAELLEGELGQSIHKLIAFFVSDVWPWLQKVLVMVRDTQVTAIKMLGKVIDNFFDGVSGVIDGLEQIFEGLINFITGVFTGDWEKAWEGVKDVFKGIWNAIASIAESAVNTIVDMLNTLAFDVPDWVPGIGGTHFAFNIPRVSIPRLAQGAVIPPNREFLAVLGDQKQGTNIEAPLDTIVEAFRSVLAESASSASSVQNISLEIDGNTLARLTLPYNLDELHRQGYNVDILGVQ